MTGRELISVIVPIYNIDKYVEKCICSIINQSYRNIEIILVDDGSTDKSGEICDSMAICDNRISVIHKENGGLSEARNRGLEESKGEIISFVDGDDWIHPQMFEILIFLMCQTNADIATCMYSNDEKDLDKRYEKKTIKIRTLTGTEAFLNPAIIHQMAWNKIYKRYIFDDIRYPVNKLHEDEFVLHKILHNANVIVATEIPLYFYMIREGSIMSSLSYKRICDTLEAFENRVEYTKQTKWDEVVSMAIIQYCDQCIHFYEELIQDRDFQTNIRLIRQMKRNVQRMIKNNRGTSIGIRYILFAFSPKLFFEWRRINNRYKHE